MLISVLDSVKSLRIETPKDKSIKLCPLVLMKQKDEF